VCVCVCVWERERERESERERERGERDKWGKVCAQCARMCMYKALVCMCALRQIFFSVSFSLLSPSLWSSFLSRNVFCCNDTKMMLWEIKTFERKFYRDYKNEQRLLHWNNLIKAVEKQKSSALLVFLEVELYWAE
jgi:hypothetical protein